MSSKSGELPHWKPAKLPNSRTIEGRFVRLEKLDSIKHGDGLWVACRSDPKLWDYLWCGPFDSREEFNTFLDQRASTSDPWAYAVIDQKTGVIDGSLTFMAIVPAHGRIEIGSVIFGAGMQRTPKGTEAVYLLAREAFELGNRRLVWLCNNLNARSHHAAQRYGFQFEGVSRQHMVVKGKNRDNATYSITDGEWPALQIAFEAWLDSDNFDGNGQQIKTLGHRLEEFHFLIKRL